MKIVSQSCFVKIIGVSLLLFSSLQIYAQAPTANFEVVGNRSACEMLIVTFTNKSTGATSYRWDFGDGSAASTVQNPTKAYTKPGVYSVTLTAMNASGSNAKTITNYITVYADPKPNFTISPTSGCAPVAVNFKNTSTASAAITKSEWNFGDGRVEESTATTIAHTYNNPNIYSVTLTMTDAHGCTATASQPSSISVYALPDPNFTVSPSATCDEHATVAFTSTTTGRIESYTWDFGDGSTGKSTISTISHEYTTRGKKTATLTVTDGNGCVGKTTKADVVDIGSFEAEFTRAGNENVCIDAPFTLTSKYTTGYTNDWFIDGVSYPRGSSLVHTFPAVGTYTVKLKTTQTSLSCVREVEKQVTVIQKNEVKIEAADTDKHLCLDANQHKNAQFSTKITSSNGQTIIQWEWRVLDGTTPISTSSQENPRLNFPGKGTFTVQLRVRDAVCGWTGYVPETIVVDQPTIDVTKTPTVTDGCLPDSKQYPVQFAGSSGGEINKWTWTIEDWTNGNQNRTTQNTTYTFTDTGVYNITLAIEDKFGCKNTKEDTVRIGKKITNVDFKSLNPVICYKDVVTFEIIDNNPTKQWTMLRWYFYDENGNPFAREDKKEDRVEYSKSSGRKDSVGVYGISMQPWQYSCKSDSVWKDAYQTILPPVAEYTLPSGCDQRGIPVTFTDLSKDKPYIDDPDKWRWAVDTYVWDFNDANKTTLTMYPIGVDAPAGSRKWEWKENGVLKTTETQLKSKTNPEFTYTEYGTYHTTLTTTTTAGCTDEWTATIVITKVTPKMSIEVIRDKDTLDAKKLCLVGDKLYVEDMSKTEVGGTITKWNWDFGNGSTPNTSKTVTYTYPDAGIFPLTLTATDEYGCKAVISDDITVWKNPTFVATTIVPERACANRAITFTDNAQSQELSARLKTWLWNFESGSSTTVTNNFNGTYTWTDINNNVIANNTASKNPNHTFATTGLKTVTLKVTDEHGCSFQNTIQTRLSNVTAGIELRDNITSPLGADFCYNKNVQLYNSSTTSQYSIASKWDLGDGRGFRDSLFNASIPSQVPASFVYSNIVSDTSFTIRLVVAERGAPTNLDAPGCTDTITKVIRISRPISRFSADVTKLVCPTPPRPIQFSSAASTTNIASVAWNFGDGTPISTMPNPQHIYEEPGEFPVELVVTDVFGCVDKRVIDPFITVDGPRGKASASPSKICVPFPVKFTAKEVEKAVSARWVFGDGNVNTPPIADVETPVSHTYTHGDTFIPVLELKDDKECTHYVKAQPIEAHLANPDFTLTNSIACSNTPVEFVNTSASSHPAITTWEWQMENTNTGFKAKSTEQNPMQILPYGNYKVRLTVKVGGCEFDILKDSVVQIYATPTADFTTSNDEVKKFEEILFENTSKEQNSGFPTFYTWNFGDNSPERATVDVSHMFTREGSYDVTLTAFEHENCPDVATKTIRVRNKVNIPNVFTPNGDNINDIFIEGLFFKNIIIINRWGQTLYEGTDGWDGRVNGVEATPGTYFYIITTFDDEVVKGALTLLRD